ncbi:MucR family transcriptional regulator, partial [Telmatospirillum sp.]|uniref:MucR family transcriptional regulator n=1 Tax=Telmatospirillum sp. TaxID=2079197 RepID=UPI00283CC6F4
APAVSIRKSVRPDAITCLECGKELSMLKRHIATDHGLSPAEYRAKWSLPSDYPMTAPDYAARRSELALKIGLGRKPTPEVAEVKVRKPRAKKKV